MMSEFRYYKVKKEDLGLLEAYKNEVETMIQANKELENEFAERAKKLSNHHHSNLVLMWKRLSASVGLDPDKTWGRAEYQVETRYLEAGFGALLYVPRTSNPLQELMNEAPEADREDPETHIPDDTTTRH